MPGNASADAYILHGLQEQSDALDRLHLPIEAGDDLVGVVLALIPGLQRDIHAAVVGGLAGDACADGGHDRRHGGVLP